MSIIEMLKKIFPRPSVPQKRYLIIGTVIIYFAMKTFVTLTPSTADDQWPDKIKDFVLTVVSLNSSIANEK